MPVDRFVEPRNLQSRTAVAIALMMLTVLGTTRMRAIKPAIFGTTCSCHWTAGLGPRSARSWLLKFGLLAGLYFGGIFYPCKETRYVRVRIKGRAEGSHCYVQLPMLDPGDILNYLHSHVLEAPMSEVQRYWDSLRSKGLLSNLVTDQHIPVTLYGDEVQINKQGDSILGLYISYTLFKPRKVRTMHYNFFTLRSHLVDGVHTLWPILRRAAASLNAVFDQPGVKFAVAEYKGDWPFLRKLFRFIPSYTGHRILAICLTCFPYGRSCVWHVCERI